MKKDLISVIIPVWRPNHNHLKCCINSVINQTYSNLEIILIYKSDPEFDNNFRGLMKEYSDKRIKIIESSQKGVAFQRNLGIKNSTGEFLANIDSDDYCIENRFERQIKVIKSKKCNVLGSWAFIISNAGKKIGTLKYPTTHLEIRKKIILHDFIKNAETTLLEILNFLGVNSKVSHFNDKVYNPYSSPRGPISVRVLKSDMVQQISKRIIPKHIRKFLRKKLLVSPRVKPKIDERDREVLIDYYKSDVLNLKKILDRKLPWSNF